MLRGSFSESWPAEFRRPQSVRKRTGVCGHGSRPMAKMFLALLASWRFSRTWQSRWGRCRRTWDHDKKVGLRQTPQWQLPQAFAGRIGNGQTVVSHANMNGAFRGLDNPAVWRAFPGLLALVGTKDTKQRQNPTFLAHGLKLHERLPTGSQQNKAKHQRLFTTTEITVNSVQSRGKIHPKSKSIHRLWIAARFDDIFSLRGC